jgi:hypothetical protein
LIAVPSTGRISPSPTFRMIATTPNAVADSSGSVIIHGRKPSCFPLTDSSTVPTTITTVPTTIGSVTFSPRNRMASTVAISGVRLITAAATDAPTFSIATKRARRPPTVPMMPAAAKRSRLRVETCPIPPVTSTQSHIPPAPTMQLIQKPV